MGLLSDLLLLNFMKRRAKRKGCGIGDMVMLKTGGPVMMVVDIDLEEAECEWFSEKDQKTHRKSFMFEMLMNVNNLVPQSDIFNQQYSAKTNKLEKKGTLTFLKENKG